MTFLVKKNLLYKLLIKIYHILYMRTENQNIYESNKKYFKIICYCGVRSTVFSDE